MRLDSHDESVELVVVDSSALHIQIELDKASMAEAWKVEAWLDHHPYWDKVMAEKDKHYDLGMRNVVEACQMQLGDANRAEHLGELTVSLVELQKSLVVFGFGMAVEDPFE